MSALKSKETKKNEPNFYIYDGLPDNYRFDRGAKWVREWLKDERPYEVAEQMELDLTCDK